MNEDFSGRRNLLYKMEPIDASVDSSTVSIMGEAVMRGTSEGGDGVDSSTIGVDCTTISVGGSGVDSVAMSVGAGGENSGTRCGRVDCMMLSVWSGGLNSVFVGGGLDSGPTCEGVNWRRIAAAGGMDSAFDCCGGESG